MYSNKLQVQTTSCRIIISPHQAVSNGMLLKNTCARALEQTKALYSLEWFVPLIIQLLLLENITMKISQKARFTPRIQKSNTSPFFVPAREAATRSATCPSTRYGEQKFDMMMCAALSHSVGTLCKHQLNNIQLSTSESVRFFSRAHLEAAIDPIIPLIVPNVFHKSLFYLSLKSPSCRSEFHIVRSVWE